MELSKNIKERFGLAYGLLGIVAAAAVFGAYKGATYHETQLPKDLVTQSELKDALGNTDLTDPCTKSIQESAAQQGLTIRSQKVTKVKQKGDTALVTEHVVAREIPPIDVTCTLVKNQWQLLSIK